MEISCVDTVYLLHLVELVEMILTRTLISTHGDDLLLTLKLTAGFLVILTARFTKPPASQFPTIP